MTDIPDRERGYSIESDTAIVHERYQDHAPRAMRTSALGVTNVLDGREAVACPTCFPAPVKRRKEGGEVRPAEPYTVGEQGTETFVPLVAGYIVPIAGTVAARDPFEIAEKLKPKSEPE